MASFTCSTCSGSGKVTEWYANQTGAGERKVSCSKCDGTGKLDNYGNSVRY